MNDKINIAIKPSDLAGVLAFFNQNKDNVTAEHAPALAAFAMAALLGSLEGLNGVLHRPTKPPLNELPDETRWGPNDMYEYVNKGGEPTIYEYTLLQETLEDDDDTPGTFEKAVHHIPLGQFVLAF